MMSIKGSQFIVLLDSEGKLRILITILELQSLLLWHWLSLVLLQRRLSQWLDMRGLVLLIYSKLILYSSSKERNQLIVAVQYVKEAGAPFIRMEDRHISWFKIVLLLLYLAMERLLLVQAWSPALHEGTRFSTTHSYGSRSICRLTLIILLKSS